MSINKILKILDDLYPSPKPFLFFRNPYEMLVATILSAQATDKQVNNVTPVLFEKYPSVDELAEADIADVFEIVKSCGFKTKAERIVLSARKIRDEFSSVVPSKLEELITLPGVGRKVADVVLANAFNIPAIAVDTHVFRVSNRLGLAHAKDVKKTEFQLMELLPKKKWIDVHHQLILLGREKCRARNPLCESCELSKYCEYKKSGMKNEL